MSIGFILTSQETVFSALGEDQRVVMRAFDTFAVFVVGVAILDSQGALVVLLVESLCADFTDVC